MKHTFTLLLLCLATTLYAQSSENEKVLRIGQAVMHPDDFNNVSHALPVCDSVDISLYSSDKYAALSEMAYWRIDTSASSKITVHPVPADLHFHYILTFTNGQTYTCAQNIADIAGGSYMHILLKGTLRSGTHIQTADEALLSLLLSQPLKQITFAHARYATATPPMGIAMQPAYTISFSKAEAQKLQMAIRIATL